MTGKPSKACFRKAELACIYRATARHEQKTAKQDFESGHDGVKQSQACFRTEVSAEIYRANARHPTKARSDFGGWARRGSQSPPRNYK